MQILRTPDSRFENLPGWSYAPHYLEIADADTGQHLRMAYVDEGPRDGATVLLLHGEPSWSYLYRHMIPALVASGHRVLAPDLIGFGRSDKPADRNDYTYERHVEWMQQWLDAVALRDITLVCQDWGGLLGLTLPMAMPERFERLIVMNTALATGEGSLGPGFLEWRAWVNANPDLPITALMQRMCPHISPAEAAAYGAPYPDARYKAGARRFPNLVPEHPDDPGAATSREARCWWRESWQGRSFMAIGM